MKRSAGILLYRWYSAQLQVLLVHPGGPFWANKDQHAWSIPKGEIDADEDPGTAALREFREETGQELSVVLKPLPVIKLSSRKILHPFIARGDFDTAILNSNSFEMEWPPRSGNMQQFPEVDQADWYTLEEAENKLHKGQVQLLNILVEALGISWKT